MKHRTDPLAPKAMSREIERIADQELREQPYGGILTCAEFPILREMVSTCFSYAGERWGAQRRIVDQLDQVTFWPLKQGDNWPSVE